MMVIQNKYELAQTVYLKTDEDQKQRIVTSILITGSGYLRYGISHIGVETWHYDYEVGSEKNVLTGL